jgi:hypothetical protein
MARAVIYADGVIYAPPHAPAFGPPRNDRLWFVKSDVIYGAECHLCAATSRAVIPGRRAAASPESITTVLADQITTREYGFRAPAFGRPRNDGRGLWRARSSMRENVIYAEKVTYALLKRHLGKAAQLA